MRNWLAEVSSFIFLDIILISQRTSRNSRNCSVRFGSGSFEVDGPFLIIAMEKEDQTSNMHSNSFRKRESITYKTTISLTERIIPALHMSGLTCFFTYC